MSLRLPRTATRLPAVIALFGALCLCLVTWADLRWRAGMIDTHRANQLINQVRLHLRAAEVQAEHLQHHADDTSVSTIDTELRGAALGSTALLTQLRSNGGNTARAAEMITAADQFAQQVLDTRQTLLNRMADQDTTAPGAVRTLHSNINNTVRHLEHLADEMRQERLRQQGWLSIVTLGLIGLGTIGLGLIHQRQSRQHQRTLDELASREAHLRAFAAAVPDVSFVIDAQGVCLEVYGQPDKLVAPAEELIGQRYHDNLPDAACQQLDSIIRRTLATHDVTQTEYSLTINGKAHWFEARAHALPTEENRVVLISWDVSERKHSEQRVKTLSRLYSFLSQVNQSIVWTKSPKELYERICRVAISHGHFTMAWIAQADNARTTLALMTHSGNLDQTSPRHRPRPLPLDSADNRPDGQHVAVRAWHSGHLRWDVPTASQTQAVAIPVRCNNTITAVLLLVRDQFDPDDAEERALFNEISTDMSFALTQFRQREQWREGQDRIRLHAAALESTQDGVIVTNLQRRIVSINRAFTEITGYSEQDVIGQTPDFLRSDRHDTAFHDQIRDSVLTNGRWQGEIWSRHRDGSTHALWSSIATVNDEQGLPTHVVSVFTDITGQKEAEARLQQMAHVDSLTGKTNRMMVLSRLEHALATARRQQHRVAVLFIDLDNFKTINDSLGHNAGDLLLQGVAQRLSQRARRDDTLGRLGGDEFILVLETLRDSEDAAAVAQELLQLLANPFDIGTSEVYVQASIGISLYPEDGSEVEELLRDADTAMYQAKRAGRGTYRYYTEALTQAAQVRLQLDTRLRRALERKEFELWYQPLYRLSDRRLIGLEALVRLNQPGLPPVGPAEFIPVLEDTGHIVALGQWVTNEACRQARAWLDEGLDFGRIAVNISPVEMQRGGTVARVQAALDAHGLSADRLELEITESGLMQQGDHSEAFLHSLRAMGVQLAIDDFGTGYSSLAYLKRFPVGKLKIDRSFVRDLMTDNSDAQLVNAMVAMGRSLGISVLAEGVETEEQVQRLLEIGCDAAQGYVFSRPQPAALVRQWLNPAPTMVG